MISDDFIGKMVGAPWDGTLNQPHIHLIYSGYLLGPISPDRGADLLGVDVHVAVVIAA